MTEVVGYPKEHHDRRVAVRFHGQEWIGFHVDNWSVSTYGVLSLHVFVDPDPKNWSTCIRYYPPTEWKEISDEPDRLKEFFGE
jgi:hypothetical protein